MTDLEITRLCAVAMGYSITRAKFQPHSQTWVVPKHDEQSMPSSFLYNPLHDDAQAMALVKKFVLRVDRTRGILEQWGVYSRQNYGDTVINDDLNRAICKCVAKMQAMKAKGLT